MPGIVGFSTNMPREWAEPRLRRMVDVLLHEPFYTSGMWINESRGIYVGWVAREGSFSDRMPVSNETGDVILFMAGEEYPEPGTARSLKEEGHTLKEEGPSYLAHLYERDQSFPANLNGRFHGLVVDLRVGSALLFNDLCGMQRLYYHESKEAFYFGAEAKAILAINPELRSLDPRSLGEYVTCGCVLENRTLFKDIHVLPPASAWVLRGGQAESKRAYFRASEWENQPTLDAEAYYKEIREVFAGNLARYFGGNQRIGVSLTGGLDTRMIMAWRKPAPGSLPCYSFAGMYRDSQDVLQARRVASVCQQSHQDILVGKDFLANFSRYAERTVYLTDGCAEVSCSPVLCANEQAREIAPVRMTGNYGGEVLRRIRAFKPVEPLPGLYRVDVLPYLTQARNTYNGIVAVHPLSFAVFRQAPWHHYSLFALEQSQLSVRSPFLDNDFIRTVFRAPESACRTNEVCLRLIADGNPALRRIRTDRGVGRTGLLSDISRNVLEFTFKAEYAYDHGMPQWVAQMDHLVSWLHLERLFLGRHKYYHFRIWYRDPLAAYIREILLDSQTLSRPFVERRAIESIVNRHIKGDRNYTPAIHQILTLELLHRLLLDPAITPVAPSKAQLITS